MALLARHFPTHNIGVKKVGMMSIKTKVSMNERKEWMYKLCSVCQGFLRSVCVSPYAIHHRGIEESEGESGSPAGLLMEERKESSYWCIS